MVRGSVLIGRGNGRSRGGMEIMANDHREPLTDPLRRGDPHDRHRALDLDDPELKLSQELALADVFKGRIHRLLNHRPRSDVSNKRKMRERHRQRWKLQRNRIKKFEHTVSRQALRDDN